MYLHTYRGQQFDISVTFENYISFTVVDRISLSLYSKVRGAVFHFDTKVLGAVFHSDKYN